MVGKPRENETENDVYLGMVPEASLYCTSLTRTGGWKAGIEWLLDSGVNVINISQDLSSGEHYREYNDIACWIDHIIYQHNVSVVAAVGYWNYTRDGSGKDISPLAYSKNVIVVGGVILSENDNAYTFSPYEDFAYSTEGLHFPHVVAPSNFGMINRSGGACIGNSFSAPLVVGTIAQLMQLEPSLKNNPSLIRSIIMSGADGIKSSTQNDSDGTCLDRKYGAGVLNAKRSFLCTSYYSVPKTFSTFYPDSDLRVTNLSMLITDNLEPVRLSLNWTGKSIISGDHSESTECSSYFCSIFKLTVTSPKGEVYIAYDINDTFQLLSFTPPGDDLGYYTVTITRTGPSGYGTKVSMSAFGCNSLS